jgi:hypothetical protein
MFSTPRSHTNIWDRDSQFVGSDVLKRFPILVWIHRLMSFYNFPKIWRLSVFLLFENYSRLSFTRVTVLLSKVTDLLEVILVKYGVRASILSDLRAQPAEDQFGIV